MSRLERILAIVTIFCAVLAILLPSGTHGETTIMSWTGVLSIGYPVLVLLLLALFTLKLPPVASGVLALVGGTIVLFELTQFDRASWGYWSLLATAFNLRTLARLSQAPTRPPLARAARPRRRRSSGRLAARSATGPCGRSCR